MHAASASRKRTGVLPRTQACRPLCARWVVWTLPLCLGRTNHWTYDGKTRPEHNFFNDSTIQTKHCLEKGGECIVTYSDHVKTKYVPM